jgi:hypothetical protein
MEIRKDDIKDIFGNVIKHKNIFKTQFNENLIQSDFTLDLSSMKTWTAAEGQELLSQVVLAAPTRKLISRQNGIKYIEELKYLDTVSGLQKYAKGWNPVGATTITVKNVSVTKMQSQELLYPEDLNDYSTQLSLAAGFNTKLPAPFETLYAELKGQYISRDIEFFDWGTQSGATNGDSWAGLGYLIPHAVGGATGATYTAFDWIDFLTNGNYSGLTGIMMTMVNKLPEAIQGEELTWFVPPSVFRKMLAVLRDGPQGQGNFHIIVTQNNGTTSFEFPAYTNLKVISTPGLSTENPNNWAATVICPAWDLVALDDLEGEDQKFTLIWNPYDLRAQFYCNFKAGIDFYFPQYITYSELSNTIYASASSVTGATGSTYQIITYNADDSIIPSSSLVYSGTTNASVSSTGLITLLGTNGAITGQTGTITTYYTDPATQTTLTDTIATQSYIGCTTIQVSSASGTTTGQTINLTVVNNNSIDVKQQCTWSIASDPQSILTSVNATTGAIILHGNQGTATVRATHFGDGITGIGTVSKTTV